MTDLTGLPPLVDADILTTKALVALLGARPLAHCSLQGTLTATIADLKHMLARLREADPSLPDLDVYDP